jgi:hypothetical protein
MNLGLVGYALTIGATAAMPAGCGVLRQAQDDIRPAQDDMPPRMLTEAVA